MNFIALEIIPTVNGYFVDGNSDSQSSTRSVGLESSLGIVVAGLAIAALMISVAALVFTLRKKSFSLKPHKVVPDPRNMVERYLTAHPPITKGTLSDHFFDFKMEDPVIFPEFPYPGPLPIVTSTGIKSSSICTIQGNQTLSPSQTTSTFKLTLLKFDPKRDTIALGFATKIYPVWVTVGILPNSIAFNCKTGMIHQNSLIGVDGGSRLSEGDQMTIKLSKDIIRNILKFKFWVNDKEVGKTISDCTWDPLSLFPTISVKGEVQYAIKVINQ